MALRRGAAHRRGDAPAGAPRDGHVRARSPEPERRAAAARRAVEVRLQEHQVDRPDPPRRDAAADHLEPAGARRVRLLLEREPGRRPSALEPEDASGASASSGAARRCRSTATPTRWRRSTRAWTCGRTSEHAAPGWLQLAVVLAAAAPAAQLGWRAYHGALGAEPIETLTHATGGWALRLLLASLAVTPLRRAFGLAALAPLRRTLGLLPSPTRACTSPSTSSSTGASTGAPSSRTSRSAPT